MSFWTEIHWSEGMFLRPHHLQASQRWMETLLHSTLAAVRPYPWGFLDLKIAKEPLDNFTLRLDECTARLKDGTWLSIPGNTEVEPVSLKNALEQDSSGVDVYLGIPQMQEVRPNSLSLEDGSAQGTPRYEPRPLTRRDENTGANPQTIYVRRIRGRVFTAGENMTGYEVIRMARIRKTDRPGGAPEMDPLGAGPLLAIQASPGTSSVLTALLDQIEARDDILAREAIEHQMSFTDGLPANTEHLLKLHAMNEARAQLKAMAGSPLLHPYDVYVVLARLVGQLAVFRPELVPGAIPAYDHDRPGDSLERLRQQLIVTPGGKSYIDRPFTKKRDFRGIDGLEVELNREWIDENLEMFVGFTAGDKDITQVDHYIKSTFNLKLASPRRAPQISDLAVRGLEFMISPVPPGTLPRQHGVHYFKVNKTQSIGPDRTDYWKECEQERGIRMSIRSGQHTAMEQLKPKLYVILRGAR